MLEREGHRKGKEIEREQRKNKRERDGGKGEFKYITAYTSAKV